MGFWSDMALIGVLLAVILGHATIGAALAALTIPQWIEIGSLIAKAAPAIVNELRALHPAFVELHTELAKGQPPRMAGMAAHTFMQQLQANASAAIATEDNLPH